MTSPEHLAAECGTRGWLGVSPVCSSPPGAPDACFHFDAQLCRLFCLLFEVDALYYSHFYFVSLATVFVQKHFRLDCDLKLC